MIVTTSGVQSFFLGARSIADFVCGLLPLGQFVFCLCACDMHDAPSFSNMERIWIISQLLAQLSNQNGWFVQGCNKNVIARSHSIIFVGPKMPINDDTRAVHWDADKLGMDTELSLSQWEELINWTNVWFDHSATETLSSDWSGTCAQMKVWKWLSTCQFFFLEMFCCPCVFWCWAHAAMVFAFSAEVVASDMFDIPALDWEVGSDLGMQCRNSKIQRETFDTKISWWFLAGNKTMQMAKGGSLSSFINCCCCCCCYCCNTTSDPWSEQNHYLPTTKHIEWLWPPPTKKPRNLETETTRVDQKNLFLKKIRASKTQKPTIISLSNSKLESEGKQSEVESNTERAETLLVTGTSFKEQYQATFQDKKLGPLKVILPGFSPPRCGKQGAMFHLHILALASYMYSHIALLLIEPSDSLTQTKSGGLLWDCRKHLFENKQS